MIEPLAKDILLKCPRCQGNWVDTRNAFLSECNGCSTIYCNGEFNINAPRFQMSKHRWIRYHDFLIKEDNLQFEFQDNRTVYRVAKTDDVQSELVSETILPLLPLDISID